MKSEFIPFIALATIFGADYLENKALDNINEIKKDIIFSQANIKNDIDHLEYDMRYEMATNGSPAHLSETLSFESIAYQVGKPIITDCIGKDDFTDTCTKDDNKTFMVLPIVVRNDNDTKISISDYDFYITDGIDETYQSPPAQAAMFMSGSMPGDLDIGPGWQSITYAVYEVDKNIDGFVFCIESKDSRKCDG